MNATDDDFFWCVVLPVAVYVLVIWPMMNPPEPPEEKQ